VNGHINDCQAELNKRLASPPSPPSPRIQPVPIEPVAPCQARGGCPPKAGRRCRDHAGPPIWGRRGRGAANRRYRGGLHGSCVRGRWRNLQHRDPEASPTRFRLMTARNTYDRNKDDLGKLCATLQWWAMAWARLRSRPAGLLYYVGYQAAPAPASDSVSLLPVLLPGVTGAVLQGRF